MANFPVLKTGAVAQYPLERGLRFSTHAVRFMDGSRQRFRLFGGGLRRWSIRLDLLDEAELAALIGFVEQQGSSTFAFTDPVSDTTAAKCIISGEQFQALADHELRARATLVIEEIA